MKTPKANRETVRSEDIVVKATASEKNAIVEAAERAGLTMSAWVRMVLAEKINQK